jgi:hypothetical protein
MKKSDAQVSHGELAKSQRSVGEKLEAPIELTPEQLEGVAGGFSQHLPVPDPKLTTTGKAPETK